MPVNVQCQCSTYLGVSKARACCACNRFQMGRLLYSSINFSRLSNDVFLARSFGELIG